jgi:hypothetical protein
MMPDKMKFSDALLLSALHGSLTRSMAQEWLEGDDLEFALRLISDGDCRLALLRCIEKHVTPELYAKTQAMWELRVAQEAAAREENA